MVRGETMGLIGNLRDAVRKTADEATESVRARAQSTGVGRAVMGAVDAMSAARDDSWLDKWPAGAPIGDFVLEGGRARKAYVYYPEALSGVKDGQRILLDVVPGDVVLYSKYSGNRLDTREDGECIALAYGTSIVAACWGYREVSMRLVAKGYRVRIVAEKRGMFSHDIPDMYVLGPDRY